MHYHQPTVVEDLEIWNLDTQVEHPDILGPS